MVELSVVVGIILLLSLLAIGSYANFSRGRRVLASAQSLSSILTTARSYAIANNRWQRVVIQFRNPDTNAEEFAYWIDEISQNSSTTPNPPLPGTVPGILKPKVTTPELLQPEVRIASVFVDNGDTATTYPASVNGSVVIRFKPDGSSDHAVVNLTGRANDPLDESKYYRVKVYGPTGKTKIFPGPGT
jgi:type II secretory pathway pseudopilin PulG